MTISCLYYQGNLLNSKQTFGLDMLIVRMKLFLLKLILEVQKIQFFKDQLLQPNSQFILVTNINLLYSRRIQQYNLLLIQVYLKILIVFLS